MRIISWRDKMLVVILPLLIMLPASFGQDIYMSPSPLPLPSLTRKNYLERGCSLTCANPFTPAPLGSICMCVVPMRIKLLLGTQVYVIFEQATQLEIEVAAGTYLKQSQVQITGASSDQSPERSVVELNLVPLEEKFDNTTSSLIYQRFFNKKVVLNRTLFGDYDLIYLEYPGLLFPERGGGPSQSGGNDQDPVPADIPKKQPKTNTQIILIVAFSTIAFLVACLATAAVLLKCMKMNSPSNSVGHSFAYWNKRSESMLSGSQASSSASIDSFMPPSVLSVKTFSLAELKIATENFSATNVLGVGGFGCVYRGTLQDGDEVAVKLLRRDQNGGREFVTEIETLSRLHHRNLVKLIGICIDERTRCLVYELVPNGSVESHLHGADQSKKVLHWDSRLKIALGAARGLAYLHEESNPRVIHRDFKSSNVLLEHDFTPKISDFGLAREATEGSSQHISTRVMGTFGYVAPEYAMTGHLLVKSDVYSYGVVLLELLSGRKPVDMSQPPGQENLVTWARPLLTTRDGLSQLVDPTMARTCDFDELAKVAAIASMCVHPEVAHRPFMGEVVQALKLICNDTDEMGEDAGSHRESSSNNSDFQGNFTPTPTYRQASVFITMEYCSDPDIQVGNRRSPDGGGIAMLTRHGNLSDPQRMPAYGPTLSTVRSMNHYSEHGKLLQRALDSDRYQGASF